MKHFLFVLVLGIQSTMLTAQSRHVEIVIQSGISVPVFDFAKTDLSKGSFALPGFTGSLETRLGLNKSWMAVLQSGIQLNPIDVGLLGYEKMQADPFLESMYIRSDPFKVIHLMAGPGYKKSIGKSFVFEGQITAGVFFASTPYQLHKTQYFLTGPPYYEITASKDISFAYGGGLRLIYEISPCYQIGLSSQFLQSKASFNFQTGSGIRTDVRNICLWNSSISLIINLFPLGK